MKHSSKLHNKGEENPKKAVYVLKSMTSPSEIQLLYLFSGNHVFICYLYFNCQFHIKTEHYRKQKQIDTLHSRFILPYRHDRPLDHHCRSFYIHRHHPLRGDLPGQGLLMDPSHLREPLQIRWPVHHQPTWELTWTRVISVIAAKKYSCGFQSSFLSFQA